MAYQYDGYLSPEEYKALGGDAIPAEVLDSALKRASRHIDALTFNRIEKAGGIEMLTPFQQHLIIDAVKEQAEFEHENADLFTSPLSGYSINGVSMNFTTQSDRIVTTAGVTTTRDIYELVRQTGLTYRGV